MDTKLQQYLGKEVTVNAGQAYSGPAILDMVSELGLIISSKQGTPTQFSSRFIPWAAVLSIDLVVTRGTQSRVA